MLFGVVALLLIMGVALFWGFQRIISNEQERISTDFSLLTRYMLEQETLLERLSKAHILEYTHTTRSSSKVFYPTDQPPLQGATLFQGISSPVETRFSMICDDLAECPFESVRAARFGRNLADLFSSFWVRSRFPASILLVVNTDKGPTYTVPIVGSSRPLLSAPLLMAAIAVIHANAKGGKAIHWARVEHFPDYMIALTPLYNAALSDEVKTGSVYAATLIHRNQINVLPANLYEVYRLQSQRDGLLIGEKPIPASAHDGINYHAKGLAFKFSDEHGIWTGYYLLPWKTLFLGNYWLLATLALLVLLSALIGWTYLRWYQRQVIAPAQQAHNEIVESDQFSRALLETTPIALFVLNREDRSIVFANTQAHTWFDTQAGHGIDDSGLDKPLIETLLRTAEPGLIEKYQSMDGRSFYVAYAPTRYRTRQVMICAFVDLSARAELEQQLTEAKQAADKANGAKSVFLATMSHEIRTPLYGVLGSLELMELTHLDHEQQQLLERIQVSSGLLLKIISDILDMTKIESGQLPLTEQAFDPRELVQSCTAAYVDIARKKGLLLFSCVDPLLPAALSGDPARISQVLTNLISNAVKFTRSGHVIVRASAEPGHGANTGLLLQVADTGIGIGTEEQKHLFTPFYQIDAHSHTLYGAGLGLSICSRLAALMGAEIGLTSELGLGSSFSLRLELPAAALDSPARQPELHGANVYVQSPHHELTDNLCQWLTLWGAHAVAFEPVGGDCQGPGILLNLFDPRPDTSTRQHPGLTVMDIGAAPHANPIDACDFRAIGHFIEHTLTGQPDSSTASRFLSAKGNNHLPPLRLNILIAEDNQINQVTLAHQLKQLGCQTTLAADGAEALELWQIGDYDLLLTDVNMPRMNGYELTCRLRAAGDDRPVLGVTANAMHDEEERCKAAGMDAWLVKPVQLRTLWNTLSQLSGLDLQDKQSTVPGIEPVDSFPGNFREIFVSTMTADIHAVRQALEAEDYDRIYHLLHRIRGSLAVAGYESLIEHVEALTQSLRQSGLTAVTRTNSLTLMHTLEGISQSD